MVGISIEANSLCLHFVVEQYTQHTQKYSYSAFRAKYCTNLHNLNNFRLTFLFVCIHRVRFVSFRFAFEPTNNTTWQDSARQTTSLRLPLWLVTLLLLSFAKARLLADETLKLHIFANGSRRKARQAIKTSESRSHRPFVSFISFSSLSVVCPHWDVP